jgi:hypothetical protein
MAVLSALSARGRLSVMIANDPRVSIAISSASAAMSAAI